MTAQTPHTQSDAQLAKDARNRAVRTFLQGLAIDIAVAIAVFITAAVAGIDEFSDIRWEVLLFTLIKTVVQTIAAYVMRRWLDPSKIPTPLPPDPPGQPAEPATQARRVDWNADDNPDADLS